MFEKEINVGRSCPWKRRKTCVGSGCGVAKESEGGTANVDVVAGVVE